MTGLATCQNAFENFFVTKKKKEFESTVLPMYVSQFGEAFITVSFLSQYASYNNT